METTQQANEADIKKVPRAGTRILIRVLMVGISTVFPIMLYNQRVLQKETKAWGQQGWDLANKLQREINSRDSVDRIELTQRRQEDRDRKLSQDSALAAFKILTGK